MAYRIDKAVVIGSGTMGAAIAAHLANAGVQVTLLDIVPMTRPPDDKEARNKIVRDGWERCLNARPANLMSSELATLVSLGNLEDDFEAVSQADWILEAVVENPEDQAGLDGSHRCGAQTGFHCQHEHIRHTHSRNLRRAIRRVQEALRRHAFFQPAAVSQAAGE